MHRFLLRLRGEVVFWEFAFLLWEGCFRGKLRSHLELSDLNPKADH